MGMEDREFGTKVIKLKTYTSYVISIFKAIQSNVSSIHPQAATVCQSYFIEPVEWIQDLHGLEGKISCPKCDSKLGTFKWSGGQCSCGSWVTPAFMMHKG